jgi:outer membrane protein OmpA-like peptidoglycan-associated protein
MSTTYKTILLLSLSGFSQAYANEQNVDITLIQPSFSTGAIPGLNNVGDHDYGFLRYGVQSFWVRDPLVYLENNIDQGAVVARRLINQTGLEYDISDRIGVHASIPVALQWATEVPSLSRNGLGVGDLQAGVFGHIKTINDVKLGARSNIFIPTSTNDAWLGENSPRISLMGNAAHSRQNVHFVAQTGFHFRTAINTEMDFVLGNEWLMDAGVRWDLWPNKIALTGGYHSRHGLNNLLRGGAENSQEISSGIQWREDDHIWHLGLSKGLNEGYGASEFQAFIGYTVHRRPVAPVEEIIPQPVVEEPVVIEEPEIIEPEWEPEELAKVEADQIIIREDIQFVVGTDTITETSYPTLEFVAKLINDDVQIGHVVIEGHASEEGSHQYNYDLSNLRARAIFKALAESGVHPDRMSHRGYGEALPKNTGEDEAALAENRRVEFHIIRQDGPDTVLELRTLQSAPWAEQLIEWIIPAPKEVKPKEESYEDNIFEEENMNASTPEIETDAPPDPEETTTDSDTDSATTPAPEVTP